MEFSQSSWSCNLKKAIKKNYTNYRYRYKIDIAALSEIRIAGEDEITQNGAGYTFFFDCSERLKADFSLVLKSYLVKLTSSPKVIHDQNMILQFQLCRGESTSNISGYTSTVINSDDIQAHFREIIIATVAKSDKLVIMAAFNCTITYHEKESFEIE